MAGVELDELSLTKSQLDDLGKQCQTISNQMGDALARLEAQLKGLRGMAWEGQSANVAFNELLPDLLTGLDDYRIEMDRWGTKTRKIALTYSDDDRTAAISLNRLAAQAPSKKLKSFGQTGANIYKRGGGY